MSTRIYWVGDAVDGDNQALLSWDDGFMVSAYDTAEDIEAVMPLKLEEALTLVEPLQAVVTDLHSDTARDWPEGRGVTNENGSARVHYAGASANLTITGQHPRLREIRVVTVELAADDLDALARLLPDLTEERF